MGPPPQLEAALLAHLGSPEDCWGSRRLPICSPSPTSQNLSRRLLCTRQAPTPVLLLHLGAGPSAPPSADPPRSLMFTRQQPVPIRGEACPPAEGPLPAPALQGADRLRLSPDTAWEGGHLTVPGAWGLERDPAFQPHPFPTRAPQPPLDLLDFIRFPALSNATRKEWVLN